MLNLKKILEKNNISQRELAQAINISPSLINKYVLNKCEPPIEVLVKMANQLHVSLDYLIMEKTNIINLESLDDDTKEMIVTILDMNNIQKKQTKNFITSITNL